MRVACDRVLLRVARWRAEGMLVLRPLAGGGGARAVRGEGAEDVMPLKTEGSPVNGDKDSHGRARGGAR